MSQGVQEANITATGYGKAKPVADNNTAQGRAQNRRVQLVVSGDAIGVEQSSPDAAPAAASPAINSRFSPMKRKAAVMRPFVFLDIRKL